MTNGPAGSTGRTGPRFRAHGCVVSSRARRNRPAFYAARPGGWRDWWTLLHPPYTAWHLSYVVIGACLAPHVSVSRLVGTLLAFLCAVGFAAHALDELHGRPLGTRIPAPVLVAVTVVGLAGAVALGVVGLSRVGWVLIPFMVLGPLLVLAYNLELFGGFVHTDAGFALAWGSFPVLVAYVAQSGTVGPRPALRRGRSVHPFPGTTPIEHSGPVHPSPRDRGGRSSRPCLTAVRCPSTSRRCLRRSKGPCGRWRGLSHCWQQHSPSRA